MTKTILIAVPTSKYIEVETFKSIYDLIVPPGYRTEFQYFYGYRVDQIRNLIASWGQRYDYLFCVDSDIVLPPDTLLKMIRADKDVISGMYIQRKPGEHILEIYIHKSGGIMNADISELPVGVAPIAACGFGCVLIKGGVLRTIPYPHFEYKHSLDFQHTVSEDVDFCVKAVKHGFGVWVDSTIHCQHVGASTFVIDPAKSELERAYQMDALERDFVAYLSAIKVKRDAEGKTPAVIYDIGACVGHWTRHAARNWRQAQIFTFDANPAVEPVLKRMGYPYHLGPLTDRDGRKLNFYNPPANYGGPTYMKENTPAFAHVNPSVVHGLTLATVVNENGWPSPDMIKMDVQGAELDILKGAGDVLTNVKDIFLEAQHAEYNQGAPQVDEVVAYMASIGFRLEAVITKGEVDGNYHFTRD